MKKILIFIVGIIGIGVSFCSADVVSWNSLSDNPVYNSSFSVVDSPYYFNITGKVNKYNNCVPKSRQISLSSTIYITGNNFSSVSLTNLCVPYYAYSSNNSLSLNINGVDYTQYTVDSDSTYICFDFSNNPILLSDFSFTYYYHGVPNYPQPRNFGICTYPYTFYFRNISVGDYYFKLNDDLFFTSDFPVESSMDYVALPVSFSLSYEVPTPKFKVNYGDTSYEYTLEDNLEIRLDSPVVKNGDIYSYVGSTGINLFYNGSTQFYSKDKLYLFTPSRYSNNIFTPICL